MSLQDQIKKKQEELQILQDELAKQLADQQRSESIIDLSEISVEDKVKKFDRLYKTAISIVNETIENGYENDDDEYYAWEALMKIVIRDKEKFWDFYNKAIK